MRIIFGLMLISMSACSVPPFIAGQVAHQVITCTSSEECKEKLSTDCQKGGVIHGIKQAVEIEYSCNPS